MSYLFDCFKPRFRAALIAATFVQMDVERLRRAGYLSPQM